MNTKRSLFAIPVAAFAAPSLGVVDFSNSATLATAQRPDGVAAADFTGDGVIDLAVAVDTPDRIDIFPGTGGGAFAGAIPVFTGAGTGPGSVRALDFDADGDADLAVILNNINTLRIYLNSGGVFSAGPSVGVGAEPVHLTVADLDADGDMDFVTANRDANTVSVVLNNAGALVSSAVPTGAEPRATAVGDFTGDGAVDIAATNHDDRTISILAGNGAGGFAPSSVLPTNPTVRPEGVVAADLDNDGDTDLAAALSDDFFNVVGVYLNNGSSLGAPTFVFTNGLDASDIGAADLNGDGLADLVTTNTDSSDISVMENSGGGAFAAGILLGAGAHVDGLELADLDGNGSVDIAATNRDSNSTTLWFTEGAAPQPCNGADLAEPLGTLDFSDVTAFLTAFGAMNPDADLAAPFGQFDFSDVVAFLSAFGAGCP